MQIRSVLRKMARYQFIVIMLISYIPVFSQNSFQLNNKELAEKYYTEQNFKLALSYYKQYILYDGNGVIDYDVLFMAHSSFKEGDIDFTLWSLEFMVNNLLFDDDESILLYFGSSNLSMNSRFKNIINRCLCNKAQRSEKYDSSLATFMSLLYLKDQSGRSIPITTTIPADSKDLLRTVDSIYEKYGWLNSAEIGFDGAAVQFLAIQHSPLDKMRERSKRVKAAYYGCQLSSSDYALFVDRLRLFSGRKQIYGTQLVFDPIKNKYVYAKTIDDQKLDDRRKRMWLLPIEAYLKGYNEKPQSEK